MCRVSVVVVHSCAGFQLLVFTCVQVFRCWCSFARRVSVVLCARAFMAFVVGVHVCGVSVAGVHLRTGFLVTVHLCVGFPLLVFTCV